LASLSAAAVAFFTFLTTHPLSLLTDVHVPTDNIGCSAALRCQHAQRHINAVGCSFQHIGLTAVGKGEKKTLHCIRFRVCLLLSTSRSSRLYSVRAIFVPNRSWSLQSIKLQAFRPQASCRGKASAIPSWLLSPAILSSQEGFGIIQPPSNNGKFQYDT
jgi:hypothetical protein